MTRPRSSPLTSTDTGRAEAQASLAYWRPRVAAGFGVANSARYDTQARFGIRHTPNETLLAQWEQLTNEHLAALGL